MVLGCGHTPRHAASEIVLRADGGFLGGGCAIGGGLTDGRIHSLRAAECEDSRVRAVRGRRV